MQRQAKNAAEMPAGRAEQRAVTPRSAFIVLACTAIAEYFALYLRLADAGAKREFPTAGM